MYKTLFLTLIILVLILNCTGSDSPYLPVDKFDPDRDPAADLTEVIDKSRESNQRILLDIGGNWCIWCEKLDSAFTQNNRINSYLRKNFLVLKVNVSSENSNKEFLSNYPMIDGCPHLFILESDGTYLGSKSTSELETGSGYSEEKIIDFLQTWRK